MPASRWPSISTDRLSGRRLRSLAFWLALPACLIVLPLALFASDKPKTETTGHPDTRRVQDLVDGLRARLALASSVRVSMVPKNALLFSVEVDKTIRNTYVLRVDEGFVAQLTDEELEAVVAHELGHVWIFTHHPYLQTEQLANQVAMRVVNRSMLEAVYHKVWGAGRNERRRSRASSTSDAAVPRALTGHAVATWSVHSGHSVHPRGIARTAARTRRRTAHVDRGVSRVPSSTILDPLRRTHWEPRAGDIGSGTAAPD